MCFASYRLDYQYVVGCLRLLPRNSLKATAQSGVLSGLCLCLERAFTSFIHRLYQALAELEVVGSLISVTDVCDNDSLSDTEEVACWT